MNHIAIDLGAKESQICVRNEKTDILEEKRIQTRCKDLQGFFAKQTLSRVILEAGSEAFWVAEIARAAGHDVRVVAATLAPALGVGARRLKTDRRDASALSLASCRVELPSIHIPSQKSRDLKSLLGTRDLLVSNRRALINRVHGQLRTSGQRIRSGKPETFSQRIREQVSEVSASMAYLLSGIDELNKLVQESTKVLEMEARQDERAVRLQTVPGVGPITALYFCATLDQAERFPSASNVSSYLGVVPSAYSSGQTKRRGGITKAGSSPTRRVLVQAAWAAQLSKRHHNDPMLKWTRKIARRSCPSVATVALAHKLTKVLFALLRDGTTYQPHRAAQDSKEPSGQAIVSPGSFQKRSGQSSVVTVLAKKVQAPA